MSLLRNAVKAVTAVSTAWVDHDMALPPALSTTIEFVKLPAAAGTIAYYTDKRGTGRPILLIHSINAAPSAREMQPLFEHYRGQRPVYALDLPGYGHSDRSSSDYSPALYADVIAAFLRDVVGESADVIALSLGCEFVARAAVAAPQWFESLVFISPSGFVGGNNTSAEPSRDGGGSDRAYNLLSFPLWSQGLYDLLVTKRSIRFFLQKSFHSQEPAAELVDYGYLTAHRPNAKNAPLCFLSGRLFTKGIARSIYSKLTMQTLVLFDTDPYVNFDQLTRFVTNHPQWQMTRIVDTKGLPHWEKPQQTFAEIDRFWQQHDPAVA
jgi:pimeloyl-ACP methyl ester carboxylesterase